MEVNFFLCEKCGNIAHLINDSGNNLTCCGKEMRQLQPNAAAGAQPDRHIPMITVDGQRVTVFVGKQTHPMTPRHAIEWIAVSQNDRVYIARIPNDGQPHARFLLNPLDGHIDAYAYCSQHELWINDELV